MTIFLAILKVIGIILLVILGLVLLILLLVLFTPISYRLTASHNEEDTSARAKFGFLVVRGIVNYNKGSGLDYAVKVLLFKIFPGKETPEEDFEPGDVMDMYEDTSEESSQNMAAESIEVSNEAQSEEDELIPDFESDNNETSQSIQTASESTVNLTDDSSNEDFEYQENEAADDTIEDDIETIEEEKIPISEKIDNGLEKLDKKLDKIDKKKNDLLIKYDHIMQFLEREYVQRTIKRALKVLKRLFGTIKPKKSKGYLRMGLSSSADTGMTLGKLSTIYPLYGRWLKIEPDFYNKVLEGDIDIKGRIYLFRFVLPVLGIALTRDFWKTYKLAKKI